MACRCWVITTRRGEKTGGVGGGAFPAACEIVHDALPRKRCWRVADYDDACQRPVCGHESVPDRAGPVIALSWDITWRRK